MAHAQALHRSESGARWLAGIGLAGRGGFYLIVAALAVEIAVDQHSSRQANASGAMALVTRPTGGKALVAAIALGLVFFAGESIVEAWKCRGEDKKETLFAALRGIFYLAVAWIPIQYVSGNHKVGSEQQQHSTAARLLGIPGGEILVIVAGLVVIAVCGWQIYSVIGEDPADQLDLSGAPRFIRALAPVLGRVGIFMRAATILPVGVLLIIAALQYDPRKAAGLDGELAVLARYPWGRALLLLIAAGLVAFGLYSFLEARYRDLEVD